MDRALDLIQLRLEESKVSLLGLPAVTAPWADESASIDRHEQRSSMVRIQLIG